MNSSRPSNPDNPASSLALAEREATEAIIRFAKTGRFELTMLDRAERYMELSGANAPTIGGIESNISRRRIGVQRLLIDCINPLTRADLARIEPTLMHLAAYPPSDRSSGLKR